MSKPARRKLKYPTCTKCFYNLTGIALVQNEYTCPECGTVVNQEQAITAPYYIGRYSTTLSIAAIPPILALLIGFAPIWVMSNQESRKPYSAAFLLISLLAIVWSTLISAHYAIKVARWKGPNNWNGPLSTFATLFMLSTVAIGVFLVPMWIVAFAFAMAGLV